MRPNVNVPSDVIAILGDIERNKTFVATSKSLVEYEHLLCGARYDWVVWVREPTYEEYGVILPMICARPPTRLTDERRLENLDSVIGLIAGKTDVKCAFCDGVLTPNDFTASRAARGPDGSPFHLFGCPSPS